MRPRGREPSRSRASRDRGDEHRVLTQPCLQQREDGKHGRGREASGLRRVAFGPPRPMLGHRADEGRKTRRGTVRAPVDRRERLGASEPEVGREIDRLRQSTDLLRPREECVEELRGRPVRGRGEHAPSLARPELPARLLEALEGEPLFEMRERSYDRLPDVPRRDDASGAEARVERQKPKELAGDVPAPPEDDDGDCGSLRHGRAPSPRRRSRSAPPGRAARWPRGPRTRSRRASGPPRCRSRDR
jgi:hypothetical protein